MKKFGFPPSARIRHSRDFERIYKLRQRAGDRHLLVFAAPNDEGRTRIGLSVSRKHGKATRRTRIKRLLREAFRLSQHDLPRGLDLILIPRKDSGAGLRDYQRSLVRLTKKLDRRLRAPETPRES